MSFISIIILALIQGVTEFLPVSSSAHLILFPQLTGGQDQGLAMDVAVHVGTLFAVIIFFWRDVNEVAAGALHIVSGRVKTPQASFTSLLALATIPVVVAGLFIHLAGITEQLRDIRVIAWTMIIFGIVLYWFDKRSPQMRVFNEWSWRDAVIMGFWQALALIPGTSRSGATITAARQLGFVRVDAARLAMLMSIPTILASGSLIALEVMKDGGIDQLGTLALAICFAFFAAIISLTIMMRLLKSISFLPYVVYRVVLGIILLVIAYT